MLANHLQSSHPHNTTSSNHYLLDPLLLTSSTNLRLSALTSPPTRHVLNTTPLSSIIPLALAHLLFHNSSFLLIGKPNPSAAPKVAESIAAIWFTRPEEPVPVPVLALLRCVPPVRFEVEVDAGELWM